MNNKNFNSEAFLAAVKNVTSTVRYSEKNKHAKRLFAIILQDSMLTKKEVLDYVINLCNIPTTPTDDELEKIIKYHKNWNGKFGKLLNNYNSKNKKIDLNAFSTIAKACGLDPKEILMENYIDLLFGWKNVLDALKEECKDMTVETKAVEFTEAVPAVEDEAEEIPEEDVLTPSEPETTAETTSVKMKKVIVMKTKDGTVVREFKSSKEIQSKTGINDSSIRKWLNGISKKEYHKANDGNEYTFEYKEVPDVAPVKTNTGKRSYTKSMIVVKNIKTGEENVYTSAKDAANAIGVDVQKIYYRAKNASDHKLNDTYEVWCKEKLIEKMEHEPEVEMKVAA